jgi:type IV pilus assembly protein PilY1
MKNLFISLFMILTGVQYAQGAYPTSGASQDGYCFIPPYMTQNVKPNINFLLDVSGSMQQPAYMDCNRTGDTAYISGCATQTLAATELYNSTRDYFGYFDNTKYYSYNATNSYFEVNSTCTNTDRKGNTSGCLSGNLLNWIVTTREDTVRKILTGGRVKSGSVTATTAVLESDGAKYISTDTNLRCTFTLTATNTATSSNSNTYAVTRKIAIANQSGYTCSLGTLAASYTNVKTPIEEVNGVVQGLYNQAVLEVSVFGESASDYRVGKGQPLASYVSALNSELAYGATPTGSGMQLTRDYFKQVSSCTSPCPSPSMIVPSAYLGSGNYLKDPYFDSDGAATPASLPVPCRKSFVLLISDGMWPSLTFTENTSSTPHTQDPVQYAHSMRKTDQRADTGLEPDDQFVTTYVVYAYGDGEYGRNSLIATAIFGGYEDKYGAHVTPPAATTTANGWPYPFTALPKDSRAPKPVTTANYTPYALNLCNPAGTWHAECAEWDKDRTGLPYNYFEGDDGAALQLAINKAVNDMLNRASSGTAASMLGNADSSGAVMLQALFFPEKQFRSSTKAKWLGEVQAFWYYIDPTLNSDKVSLREDTNEDKKLKKTEDRIAKFVFNGTETKVNLYDDANGDGLEDSTLFVEENTDEVNALWQAGLTLWSRMPTGAGIRTVYTNNLSGTATANNLMGFSTANLSLIKPYLDVASNDTDATNVINYTLGIDPDHIDLASSEKLTALSGYRSRTVEISTSSSTYATHVWKLGDVINSTPKMISQNSLNSYNNPSPGGYGDLSYGKFVSTLSYKNRGVAFVGANDGMLHAFKMGKNIPGRSGYVAEIADSTDLSGGNVVAPTELGKELWSYIPKNVLPYLKHRGNPDYKHMYFVDSTPTIIDASIGAIVGTCSNNTLKGCSVDTDCGGSPATCNTISPACTSTVSDCPKVDASWRTVLIGSMGLGGATRNSTATCTNCVKTPIANYGYSSYFALDVTDSSAPKLLWEFADPRLGYSTVGPAIVRIKDSSETGSTKRNGKFYAVLASGPTGPVDSGLLQMKGYSDQSLALFVLDMRTGQVVQTISREATAIITGVPHLQQTAMPDLAFGGTFSNSTIDTDKWSPSRSGTYSDDVVYLGYVRKDTTTGSPSINKFAKGGVLRILTGDDPDPSNWRVSTVVDGIGPVTSSVAKLQDTTNRKLWLYFGTGRYFYKNGSAVDEDYTGQQEAIYAIKEPCYISDLANANKNDLDATCTTAVTAADLQNQTTSIASTIADTTPGWKINLAALTTSFKPQRIYTNPTVTSAGAVFFTAFKPSAAVCSYGGSTSLWAVKYDNGGSLTGYNLRGQALLQLSTGELKQIDLSDAFTESSYRETTDYTGPPSKDETQITSNANHFPVRKILHIQER